MSNRLGPDTCMRAMPVYGISHRPARATHESSPVSRSRPKVGVAIASGFPIVRTAKVRGEMDHEIINPALREWLAR
jgi:hypothetical protein